MGVSPSEPPPDRRARRWALIEMYLPLGRVDEAVAAADVLRQQGVKAPGSFVLVGLAYLAAANVEAARETLDSATVTLGEDFPVTLLLQFAIFDATGDREGAVDCSTGWKP